MALNDEQIMLKDMAAGWVDATMPTAAARGLYGAPGGIGHAPDLWAEMAAMGWTGIIAPEAHGGSDFGFHSLGLVLEELGRTLAPSPLLSSAMAVSALRLAGDEAQQARWMPGLADGSVIGTLAVDEGPRHAPLATALTAVPVGGGWRLDGVKRPVQDGMAAHLAIVVARVANGGADDLALFVVPSDSAGLTRDPLDQIDARVPAIYRFDAVEVGPDNRLAGGTAMVDALLDRARVGLSAEMLGMMTQAFETTLEYLKTRVQFGQLIGSFQALQHRAAEMFAELQLTRSAVEAALSAVDKEAADLPARASLAKALAGEALYRISRQMVQLHGGIGMTHEHDAGLYLRRAGVVEQCYGNAAFHRERWGRLNGF